MTEFSVKDMTCGHCSSAITQAIMGVDADSKVDIDLGKRTVRITSAKSPAQFLGAIRGAGYTPVIGAEGSAPSTPSCCQS
jgi:copper chaperone